MGLDSCPSTADHRDPHDQSERHTVAHPQPDDVLVGSLHLGPDIEPRVGDDVDARCPGADSSSHPELRAARHHRPGVDHRAGGHEHTGDDGTRHLEHQHQCTDDGHDDNHPGVDGPLHHDGHQRPGEWQLRNSPKPLHDRAEVSDSSVASPGDLE